MLQSALTAIPSRTTGTRTIRARAARNSASADAFLNSDVMVFPPEQVAQGRTPENPAQKTLLFGLVLLWIDVARGQRAVFEPNNGLDLSPALLLLVLADDADDLHGIAS